MFLSLNLWKSILCTNGRVDILVCNVNPSEALFSRFLWNARADGIQVYYSSNRTGSGGDWVLEHDNVGVGADGNIEAVYLEAVAAADIKTPFTKNAVWSRLRVELADRFSMRTSPPLMCNICGGYKDTLTGGCTCGN